MAAQFSATNGPPDRRDLRWMWRASTSLPVPLSPVISTDASAAGDLLGPAQRLEHRRVARDQAVAVAAGGLQDGGDQLRVGRQRQELPRAVADGAHGGGSASTSVPQATTGTAMRSAASARTSAADVVADLAQYQVHPGIRAQPGQRGIQPVRLLQLVRRGRSPSGRPGPAPRSARR